MTEWKPGDRAWIEVEVVAILGTGQIGFSIPHGGGGWCDPDDLATADATR